MADPRFFKNHGPFTVAELVTDLPCTVQGNESLSIQDVAPLHDATQGQCSFFDNAKYLDAMRKTQASACIMHPDMAEKAPQGLTLILTQQPYLAYAQIASLFYPSARAGEIHDSAVIDKDAEIAEGVSIGANTVIGPGVVIGKGSVIYANVTITHAKIGQACTIHSGARIGQDGFGFAPSAQGMAPVPQLGRVIIGNHVNIGANTTIDRGAGPDTIIGDGTIIDNLVQIAHNVQIGRGCIIAAQVGISGSTKMDDYVVMGGQSGVAGHLNIGKGVKIAGQSGVTQNIKDGIEVVGFPAQERRSYWKERAFLRRLMKKG